MLGIGIIIGIVYGILNIFTTIKKNFPIQIVADLIFSILLSFTFLVAINILNMGQFRFFLFIGYMLGFIVERITLGKLFAKGFKKVYNFLVKGFKKFFNSHIGRIIFK